MEALELRLTNLAHKVADMYQDRINQELNNYTMLSMCVEIII